jgi:hypothetical protein
VNHKRLFRLYREERLGVRRRGRPQTGVGNPGTDDGAPSAQPALVSQALLFNASRPHSRLGWMTPNAYAGVRRSPALRSTDGSAPRIAAIAAQEGITDRLDKTSGQAHEAKAAVFKLKFGGQMAELIAEVDENVLLTAKSSGSTPERLGQIDRVKMLEHRVGILLAHPEEGPRSISVPRKPAGQEPHHAAASSSSNAIPNRPQSSDTSSSLYDMQSVPKSRHSIAFARDGEKGNALP